MHPMPRPLQLRFTPPYELGIFGFLGARAVDGVEAATAHSYARTVALPGGHGWFKVWWQDNALWLEHQLADSADAPVLFERVRHLFNLDHEPQAADAVLARHPLLAPSVAAIPGIRVPGCVDAGEILIRAMVGQQITVAAARTMLNRLAVLGAPCYGAQGGMQRLFPDAAGIAAHGRDILRGPRRRIDAILGVAGLLADGSLALGPGDTLESLGRKLLPLPGIGPWTVGYVAMRVLGTPDIFLPGDAAVRNGYARLRGIPPAQARTLGAAGLTQLADAARPWRSQATMHLWRAAAQLP